LVPAVYYPETDAENLKLMLNASAGIACFDLPRLPSAAYAALHF